MTLHRSIGAILAGLVSMSLTLPAGATEGEMVVTSNTKLTEDHFGNIVVAADGITLDCDGHAVFTSIEEEGVGVLIDSRTGVTVRNCVAVRFAIGFEVANSSSIRLEGNTASLDVDGFLIDGSTNVTLSENAAIDTTGWGVTLSASDNNTFEDNAAIGGWLGAFLLADSDGNRFVGNTAAKTAGVGFWLNRFSSDNVLIDNEALGNGPEGGSGFGVDGDDNTLTMNWAEGNGGSGFAVGGGGNTFTANSSHFNAYAGFYDQSPSKNTYVDNICVGNHYRNGYEPSGLCDESGTFSDDDGSTFERDIEWMNREGVTRGCNPPVNDRFCPDDFVTRGQMAAFLHRGLGDILTPTGQVEFVDDDGSIFEADIEWLGGTGVTKGCNPPTNDKYCPDDFVTRGQMAAFLVRALGYTDDGGGNLFVDDDGNTFENDIDKLATAGVTMGCNPPANTEYCPNDIVTRGQMAAFVHRALGN